MRLRRYGAVVVLATAASLCTATAPASAAASGNCASGTSLGVVAPDVRLLVQSTDNYTAVCFAAGDVARGEVVVGTAWAPVTVDTTDQPCPELASTGAPVDVRVEARLPDGSFPVILCLGLSGAPAVRVTVSTGSLVRPWAALRLDSGTVAAQAYCAAAVLAVLPGCTAGSDVTIPLL